MARGQAEPPRTQLPAENCCRRRGRHQRTTPMPAACNHARRRSGVQFAPCPGKPGAAAVRQRRWVRKASAGERLACVGSTPLAAALEAVRSQSWRGSRLPWRQRSTPAHQCGGAAACAPPVQARAFVWIVSARTVMTGDGEMGCDDRAGREGGREGRRGWPCLCSSCCRRPHATTTTATKAPCSQTSLSLKTSLTTTTATKAP